MLDYQRIIPVDFLVKLEDFDIRFAIPSPVFPDLTETSIKDLDISEYIKTLRNIFDSRLHELELVLKVEQDTKIDLLKAK